MTERHNTKIIAFVGLPGAGKSTAVEYFTKHGLPKVYFGGVIYQAMNDAGIEITPESQQIFREQFREEHGKDVVVNKIIDQINHLVAAGQRTIIADGLYTWTEYKVLKKAFPGELGVVAIVAPRKLRYRRLADRPERPFTNSEAYARDTTEIEHLEKGGPIAIADHYVINDGTREELEAKLKDLKKELEI